MINESLFHITLGLYLLAFLASAIRRNHIAALVAVLALGFCGYNLGMRVYRSWPMLPMYLGLVGQMFCLTAIWLGQHVLAKPKNLRRKSLLLLGLILILNCLVVLFPKDFYLPFVRSTTIWAHLFLWTGFIAKAMLFMASLMALDHLLIRQKNSAPRSLSQATGWSMLGFVFLTLSMFCGEIWSYSGWGTPVVWHDPAIMTVMSLWFYWTGILHMQYSGTWSPTSRAWLMMIGGLLLLSLGSHPDLGPLRLPFH